MSQIYKINLVNNNEVRKIFVFTGPFDVKKKSSGPIINGESIFTSTEWKNITSNSIEVKYIGKYIHGDDTILRIKEKILKEVQHLYTSTSEMYLFSIQKKEFNMSSAFYRFSAITNNDILINKHTP